uniref:Uncharacterized protein n=1 Tax=Eucampia antarctica TaxID=49252 RepID=A0A7S2RCB1_9STRA|mmetsp:Transcript_20113/g.19355  ORF Transcript_20113/g.19355 Transcript_20113/m.19355 type:complete len:138 (+) Transcript_20113:235-648(+)
MVINNQLTQFYTSGTQMCLTNRQRIRLSTEGLLTINDFEYFKEDELKIAFKNVRSGISGSTRIDLVPAIVQDDGTVLEHEISTIHDVPGVHTVMIPAKSTSRLLIASVVYHYCCDTGRAVTVANMHFNNVLHNFNIG